MATKASPQGRPRLDGVVLHIQQYNVNAETVDKKLNVLDVLEKTKDMRATILRFYPNISEKLRAATQANKGGHREIRDKGTATLLSNELENENVRFVNELRKGGVPVSTAMLTIQAKKVAAEAAVSPFSASRCWVNGFMARHRMSVRAPTREGQQSPADLDNIATGLAAHVEEFVRHLGINRIYNADQTGISSNGQRIV
uniref:Uncharacterized protein AlNc14C195G8545 n=1 Tax=Albugo laibachii Nc14 TaxID=890382 RepID=F0WQ64_9STRA|nr:conserved hypothetical protein [Albugo laibachii Nc14]|eukprot:CCA23470.1 conserved hypothetical protein [Albugo laibachii Nc14]